MAETESAPPSKRVLEASQRVLPVVMTSSTSQISRPQSTRSLIEKIPSTLARRSSSLRPTCGGLSSLASSFPKSDPVIPARCRAMRPAWLYPLSLSRFREAGTGTTTASADGRTGEYPSMRIAAHLARCRSPLYLSLMTISRGRPLCANTLCTRIPPAVGRDRAELFL